MKSYGHLLPTLLVVLAALFLASLVPLTTAVGQEGGQLAGASLAATSISNADAALSTTFSYQGNLKKSGQPVTANCSFQFSLWDAATGDAAQGATQNINNVQVQAGAFSVQVDFGNQFTGDARWLQTAVQCAGEGGYTTLSPRQPLNAAPYAIGLRPGAVVEGETAPFTGVVTGRTSSPDGFGIHGDSAEGFGVAGTGGVGIYGSGAKDGIGVFGTSENGNGVYASSTNGAALSADSTNSFGVLARSVGSSGLVGIAEAEFNAGVYGEHRGTGGYGVHGSANDGAGVWGESLNWIGVYGSSNASSGVAAVQGETTGVDAVGVKGRASNSGSVGVWGASERGTGVYGHTTGDGARGVWGEATKPNSVGVFGVADNDLSIGVYGHSANNTGVYGRTATGNAVWGEATGTGFAMRADGHAAQNVGGGGWVKAMAYIDRDDNVVRCYNSQLPANQATVPPCDIHVATTAPDVRQVDFGFYVLRSQPFH